jgi:hypothetical protein
MQFSNANNATSEAIIMAMIDQTSPAIVTGVGSGPFI